MHKNEQQLRQIDRNVWVGAMIIYLHIETISPQSQKSN